jgi:hypothetical protein
MEWGQPEKTMTVADKQKQSILEGFKELYQTLKSASPGSEDHNRALSELQWQQTVMQFSTTDAQVKAANAEELSARASERAAEATIINARYMLWSVVAAAISAAASLGATLISLWSLYHPPTMPH